MNKKKLAELLYKHVRLVPRALQLTEEGTWIAVGLGVGSSRASAIKESGSSGETVGEPMSPPDPRLQPGAIMNARAQTAQPPR